MGYGTPIVPPDLAMSTLNMLQEDFELRNERFHEMKSARSNVSMTPSHILIQVNLVISILQGVID